MSSADWRLYVILDRAALGARGLTETAAQAIRGGADVIQLRDKAASVDALLKAAKALLPVTAAAGVPLIINDRPEVARTAGAQGVHVGQDDLSIAEARALMGPNCLIGRSTHNLEQATTAARQGADYIGFGPIFPTPTKPDYGSVGTGLIASVMAAVPIPVVCIGGMEERTVDSALRAGARCVAVVRAVCAAPDPEAAARRLKQLMIEWSPRNAGIAQW